MKPAGILGILLLVAGIVLLAWGGFARFTTKENVAKLGPLEVNKENEHQVPIGPIAGGVCLVGGVILLVSGARGGSAG
jgi:drug/metabolite transporter (DMT)-like permease